MMISNATGRAFDEIAARERDVLQAYTPGAQPERTDAAAERRQSFTLDPLSAIVPGDAYFVTRDVRGRLLFTRDGSFTLRDGVLSDSQGQPLMGYREDGATLAELRADPVDTALGFTANAHVEADGSVAYERTTIDPRSGRREAQRISLGRIALARFPAGSKLQAVDSRHGAAPERVAAHFGRAGDGNFAKLQTFSRESSGIDFDVSLQRLEDAYLAFDALRAAGKAQGGIQKTAMDLLK
jgi:flagellar hook protein FlgE